MSSRIPGFYRLDPEARLRAVLAVAGMPEGDADGWRSGLELSVANAMIENVVGVLALPCGVAVNLLLNGRDRLVPMVVEEPSVVAAVSNMARLTRRAGGVTAEADDSVMIGQIQLTELPDSGAADRIRADSDRLLAIARTVHPQLAALGGGVRGMVVREVVYDEPGFEREAMLVVHFLLDCADAMGANMVNTLAERLAPELVALSGGKAGLRILSNLADQRIARARVQLPADILAETGVEGREVAAGIASAYRFAWADPYRAATHNKGIMNGIDAVAIATGNDWRAIEAGAHAWAARDGQYRPLSSWRVDGEGGLLGEIAVPMQVGTVGGATRVHPTVRGNLKLAGITGARDLAMLLAAVGLIQNLGALRALASEGIQQGHMRMHARTVAVSGGAAPEEVAAVVEALVADRDFRVERVRGLLDGLRSR